MPELAALIGFLINLLVALIVLGVIYWIATLIIGWLAPNPQMAQVATKIVGVICLLIVLLWVLSFLSGQAPVFFHYRAK